MIIFKKLIQFVYLTCFILILGVTLLAFRLHLSPLDMSFLSPTVTKLYPHLSLSHVQIAWPSLFDAPKFYLEEASYTSPEVSIKMPKLVAQVDLRKLLRGQVALLDLQALDPVIILHRSPQIPNPRKKASPPEVPKLLSNLKSLLNHQFPAIEIINGKIYIDDTVDVSSDMFVDGITGRLYKDETNVTLSLQSIVRHQDSSSPIMMGIVYGPQEGKIHLEIDHLSLLKVCEELSLPLSYVQHFKETFSGTLDFSYTHKEAWTGILSAALTYHAVNNKMCFEVKTIFEEKPEGLLYDVSAQALPFSLKNLRDFWPPALSPPVREWFLNHVPEGQAQKTDLSVKGLLKFKGDSQTPLITGQINLKDAVCLYMENVPEIKNIEVQSTFSNQSLIIKVIQGRTHEVWVNKGLIRILDIDKNDQSADITLHMKGPFQDVLKILDSPGLALLKSYELSPETTSGEAQIELGLVFPLQTDLSRTQIKPKAKAQLNNIGFKRTLLEAPTSFEGGNFTFDLTPQKIQLQGTSFINGQFGTISAQEYLGEDRPYLAEYKIFLTPTAPFLSVYPSLKTLSSYVGGGYFPLYVTYTKRSSELALLHITGNLSHVPLQVPLLDWKKNKDDTALFSCSMEFQNDQLSSIPQFIIDSPKGLLHARALFKEGLFKKGTIDHLKFGKNDVFGSLDHHEKDGWHLHLKGKSLNLGPYFSSQKDEKEEELPEDLMLTVNLDHVFLAKNVVLDQLNISLKRRHKNWAYITASGKISDKESFKLLYKPDQTAKHFLFRTENMGALLRGTSILDDAYHGHVTILGEKSLGDPNAPLSGEISVQDITFKNAPFLVHLLTLASISGIHDLFGNSGLTFHDGKAFFQANDGKVTLSDGLLFNASLGLTVSGLIDFDAKTLHLVGTVIPAYMINHFVGFIPLLGTLLSGGSPQHGVFSIPYEAKGPLKDPKVTVNPFSMWVPAGMRKMFTSKEGAAS